MVIYEPNTSVTSLVQVKKYGPSYHISSGLRWYNVIRGTPLFYFIPIKYDNYEGAYWLKVI